ncbi:MAG: hypothetical protein ACR2OX_09175 [Methyloligellaceae bacterium]
MPYNIKAGLSVVALLVAMAIAYWEYSSGREFLGWFVLGTGIFMIAAMWIFPEATAKKKKG